MMGTDFDPYHVWLGIPPAEQPPHHYRLLGLPLFTADPRIIAQAAEQQLAHVRSFHSAEHAFLVDRIVKKIMAAQAYLLNPETKAAYDATLRNEQRWVQQSPQNQTTPAGGADPPRWQTPVSDPPAVSPTPAATPTAEMLAQQTPAQHAGLSVSQIGLRLAGLVALLALGLVVSEKNAWLSPDIKTILYHFLPPLLLVGIILSGSLCLALLLPAGRRWLARCGPWGVRLVVQTDDMSLPAEAETNPIARDADHQASNQPPGGLSEILPGFRRIAVVWHLAERTPLAFAILTGVLIWLFVELLLVTGSRVPTGAHPGDISTPAQNAAGETAASPKID